MDSAIQLIAQSRKGLPLSRASPHSLNLSPVPGRDDHCPGIIFGVQEVSGDEAGYAVSRLRYARKKSTCWYKEGC